MRSRHSSLFHAVVQKHQLHQFGRLITPKLRWILLRKVDIDNLLMIHDGWLVSPARCDIVPTPNPYNEGKIINVVKKTNEPALLVSVRNSFFSVSFHENAGQDILDILEKDCELATLDERVAFCDRMNSLHCPRIDFAKRPLLRNLEKYAVWSLTIFTKFIRIRSSIEKENDARGRRTQKSNG